MWGVFQMQTASPLHEPPLQDSSSLRLRIKNNMAYSCCKICSVTLAWQTQRFCCELEAVLA